MDVLVPDQRPRILSNETIASVTREVITGSTKSAPHFDVLRRTSESLDAYEHAPLHSTHEWFFQEAGKPRRSERALLLTLQLRADPSDAARHASYGSRHCESCVEH